MKNSQQTILFVITKSVWGGAQKYCYDIASHLPYETFRPIVAAGGKGLLREKLSAHAIPYYEIANFQRDIALVKDLAAGIEMLRLLFASRPHILHASSPKAAGIAGVAAWCYRLLTFFRLPLRRVVTIHGWTFNETWRPRWQQWCIRLFARLTCLLYDRVIVISRADYHAALRHRIVPAHKLIFIPHGIDPRDYQFFSPQEGRSLLPASLRQTPFLVGSIGEWTPNKGYPYLIEAAQKIIKKNPDVRFVLFGWGEQKQFLTNLIDTYKLANHVFLIENVTDAARFLKAFDVFALPSLKEGLPYVLLEAQCAGVPIVATAVGGIPEIVNKTNGVLVPPARPDLLAETILQYPIGPNRRHDIASAPVRTIEEMIADTIQCYT